MLFSVSYNTIFSKGFSRLLETIKKCKNLTSLSLQNNQLDDEGLRELADFLAKNDKINYLNLSNNNFRDVGVHHIAKSLFGNKSMRTLAISQGSNMTSLSFDILVELAKKSSIQYLDIQDPKIRLALFVPLLCNTLRNGTTSITIVSGYVHKLFIFD